MKRVETLRQLCTVYGFPRVCAVMGLTQGSVEARCTGRHQLKMRDVYRLMLVWRDRIDWESFMWHQAQVVERWRLNHGKSSLIDAKVNNPNLGKWLGNGRRKKRRP